MKNLSLIKNKIISSEHLEAKIAYWRFKDYKIVFTNGCFDLLHLGHIDYLSKSADLGDILVIGLNSDQSVQKIKGPGKPIQNSESRAIILASLQFVGAVVLFDADTPYELIREIQPDVLVKGSDYKPEDIIGADIVLAKGGEIKTIEFLEGYSTTNIQNKIKGIN